MILYIHIATALSSVAWATFGFFKPSQSKLLVSYGLMAAMLASGTYLVFSTRAHLLEACVMGLLYTAAVAVLTVSTRRKLVTVSSN